MYFNIYLRNKIVIFKRVEGLVWEGEDDIFKWLYIRKINNGIFSERLYCINSYVVIIVDCLKSVGKWFLLVNMER